MKKREKKGCEQKKQIIYKIFNTLKKFKKIAIFRHIHPDFDALSASCALQEFIKNNYKDKDIKILGDNHKDLTPRLFPKIKNLTNKWFDEPFLAIILDTPNKKRIADERWKKASLKIKIDHHPFVEKIGEIEYIEEKSTSTCEILAEFFFDEQKKNGFKISKKCASYLYTGIVGDSGRFAYNNTNSNTFIIASKLINLGIDLKKIYHDMYLRQPSSLKIMAKILNNFSISPYGTAYYVFYRKDLKELNSTPNQCKEHVNIFHFIDGIKIWCSIVEDLKEKCFRVSIRSEKIDIRPVAIKWNGGGHVHASGAKIFSSNEISKFIKNLDNLIKKSK